jgi:hypothetical protein
MLLSTFPYAPLFHTADTFLRSSKKSISRIQSVASSRHARKTPSFQNRAQKPFSDTPYLSRKQRFCAHPTKETLEFAAMLLGKNSPRRKNSFDPVVGSMRHTQQEPSPVQIRHSIRGQRPNIQGDTNDRVAVLQEPITSKSQSSPLPFGPQKR